MLEAVDEQDQLGHWSRSTLTTIVCYGDESLLGLVHVDDLASFNGSSASARGDASQHVGILSGNCLHYDIYC